MADDLRGIEAFQPEPGTLYVAATPIGNLLDASVRLKTVLGAVDVILAEDTRKTGKLMNLLGIAHKRLVSYHEHNEELRTPQVLGWLEDGRSVCLVSDAGTPLISDPGYRLVRAARLEGYKVIPIPGPSAAVAALSVSGLPTDRFLFLGFLPKRPGRRRRVLESAKGCGATVVVYVPARSVPKVVEEVTEVFGDVEACLCREITKLHEEHIFGKLSEIKERLAVRDPLKGEVTLVFARPKEEKDG